MAQLEEMGGQVDWRWVAKLEEMGGKVGGDGWLSWRRWVAKLVGDGCMARLVARLLATAALWVRIQTYLKHTKWATKAKEWPKHSSPPKNIEKTICCIMDRSISGDYEKGDANFRPIYL